MDAIAQGRKFIERRREECEELISIVKLMVEQERLAVMALVSHHRNEIRETFRKENVLGGGGGGGRVEEL